MTPRSRLVTLVAAAVIGASGCSANMVSSINTGGVVRPVSPIAPVVPPVEGVRIVSDGGLFVSATVAVSATTANVIAGVFILGILAAENGLSPLPPPKMREDRTINLQDCSKPIVNWSANLKCATPEELRDLASAGRD